MTVRPHGKAGFAHLAGGGVRLQIYVRLDAVGEQLGERLVPQLVAGQRPAEQGALHLGADGVRETSACGDQHLPQLS